MLVQNSPFFIVGAQRSGTTMLRLMLNQHSRLNVPFESGFIPALSTWRQHAADAGEARTMAALLAEIGRHPFVQKGGLLPDPDAVLARNPSDYAGLVDAMFDELARRRGKERWGDKTPSYVTDMDLLWKLFPGCMFVHLIRDGRDVANSLRGLSWGSRNLIKAARDWRWKVMLGRKMGRMIPAHYLEVHYEALVHNPVEVLTSVCDFLGERFEEGMLSYHETATEEMPEASLRWHQNSVAAPNPEKSQSWRRSMCAADRVVFEEIAGDALDMFGYERSRLQAGLASKVQFFRYTLFGHA